MKASVEAEEDKSSCIQECNTNTRSETSGTISADCVHERANSSESPEPSASWLFSAVVNNAAAALFCSLSCRQSRSIKKQDNYAHNERRWEEKLKFRGRQVNRWMKKSQMCCQVYEIRLKAWPRGGTEYIIRAKRWELVWHLVNLNSSSSAAGSGSDRRADGNKEIKAQRKTSFHFQEGLEQLAAF